MKLHYPNQKMSATCVLTILIICYVVRIFILDLNAGSEKNVNLIPYRIATIIINCIN